MDKKDRRINHVVLTDSGKELMNTISLEAETDFVRNALLKMQSDELENFLSCYEKFMAQIRSDQIQNDR
jgi:DNA-binding MarR family transcriptional regulator